mgnify:CR=1 FL=1
MILFQLEDQAFSLELKGAFCRTGNLVTVIKGLIEY